VCVGLWGCNQQFQHVLGPLLLSHHGIGMSFFCKNKMH
jgi:hypothetical protein